MPTFGETLQAATQRWKENPRECLALLKAVRNEAQTPQEILAAEQELLVYGEWHSRILGGLNPYHSHDTSDVGFRFTDMSPYLRATEHVGGVQSGFGAFVGGAYKTAQRIWSEAGGITQNFRLEIPQEETGGWVDVEHLRMDRPGMQAWMSCDGKYFEAFGDVLLKSLTDNGMNAHVHIMDPTKEAIKAVTRIAPHAGLSIEYPGADRVYYHAARFKRFVDMPHMGTRWFLDVDAICNQPLDIEFSQIAMRVRPARIEPWNQFNACMIGVKPEGLPYMRNVARWLSSCRKTWFWGVDQLALWCVWRAMEHKPDIRCLTPRECDYDYVADGVIWCNSGAGKFTGDTERPVYNEAFLRIKATCAPPITHPETLEDAIAGIDEAIAECTIQDIPQPPELRPRKIERFIYMPVEIKQRELASKAQLAGEMARRGFDVVLGASWNMSEQRYGDLPPGIVLHKTCNALDAMQIFQCATSGHLNVVMNEELFAMPEDEELYRINCNPWAMLLADAIFAHGRKSSDLLKRLTTTPSKVRVTGAMRAGERHGGNPKGDILLCMSPANINSLVDYKQYIGFALKTYGRKPGKEIGDLLKSVVSHEWAHREGMLRASQRLREAYPSRFKLRPHPAEDKTQYADFADCMDEGLSFSEAVRNAACVIFVSGCGTGLEAYHAGVPIVRYGEGGHGLSRELGLYVSRETPERIVDAVSFAMKYGIDDIGALDGHFAENTVADALQSMYHRHAYSMPYFDLADCWKARAVEFVPGDFHRRKFPETTTEEVSKLAGLPVEQLGWNIWLCRAIKN